VNIKAIVFRDVRPYRLGDRHQRTSLSSELCSVDRYQYFGLN
jgi:hypothetical protein